MSVILCTLLLALVMLSIGQSISVALIVVLVQG